MDNIIVLRYGELYLKGKNRGFFERQLIGNIKNKLKGFDCELICHRGRYEVSGYDRNDESRIINALKTVFGLKSLSIAQKVPSDISIMSDVILEKLPRSGTFKVDTHRADKTFPLTSPQVSAALGEKIIETNKNLSVDLHNPDIVVNVDIREDKYTYIYTAKEDCAGGMPVGCAGKGLLMLSGGIDSPVSGYMLAKRGLSLDAIHFHSYPYTSVQAKDSGAVYENTGDHSYKVQFRLYDYDSSSIYDAHCGKGGFL